MTADRRPDAATAAEESRLLRRLVDSIPAMVSYWDRDLRNVVANQAYVEYFGLTPAEMRGRHLRDLLGEELYERNRADLDAVLRGEQREFERAFEDRDGRTRYMQTAFVPEVVDGEVVGFYGFGSDLTSRVEAERACDDAERLLRVTMDNAPIGQTIADMSLRAVYVNPAFCEMAGYTADELIGVNFRDFVHPDDVETAKAEFDALKNTPQSHLAAELRVVGRDGATRWIQRDAVVVPGAHGSEDLIIGQFQDITDRKAAEAELARLAVTDALTGLLNRQAFLDAGAAHRGASPAGRVGIVFIDLDGFKRVNDQCGHAGGDAVLVQIAERIKATVAEPDSVYRIGGDEFVVVSADADADADAAAVAELAERVQRALTGDYETGGVPVELSASVGSASGSSVDFEVLLREADADMYAHKARGGE